MIPIMPWVMTSEIIAAIDAEIYKLQQAKALLNG